MLGIRHAIVRAVGEVTRRFDALIAPMNPLGARPIEPPADGGEARPSLEPRLQYQRGLSGIPAITAPCGFTTGGLPVSLTFVAGAMQDAAACQMAHAFELVL